jgi:hypothetical protein
MHSNANAAQECEGANSRCARPWCVGAARHPRGCPALASWCPRNRPKPQRAPLPELGVALCRCARRLSSKEGQHMALGMGKLNRGPCPRTPLAPAHPPGQCHQPGGHYNVAKRRSRNRVVYAHKWKAVQILRSLALKKQDGVRARRPGPNVSGPAAPGRRPDAQPRRHEWRAGRARKPTGRRLPKLEEPRPQNSVWANSSRLRSPGHRRRVRRCWRP